MNRIIARIKKMANDLVEDQVIFIQKCEESGKFDFMQIGEIRKSFKTRLTIEQIKLYADSKFTWDQMWMIRTGFENGLTMEQVKLYADPNFNYKQMQEIRYRLENEWTIEEIKNKYKLASKNNKLNRIARKLK